MDIPAISKTCLRQVRIPVVLFSISLAISTVIAPQAKASFLNPYSLGQFTFLNTNADGSFESPDGGLSVIITGGNNGSGFPGTTDLFINAAASGAVSFQYSYSSIDAPGFDFGGYLISGVFTPFPDQAGSITFPVVVGQSFGFEVMTADNTGGPGVVTISDFSAPGTAVPEPRYSAFVALCVGAALLWKRIQSRATLRCVQVMGITLALSGGLSAQSSQTFYTGTNITGQLTQSAVVDPRNPSQGASAQGAIRRLPPGNKGPEFKPHWQRSRSSRGGQASGASTSQGVQRVSGAASLTVGAGFNGFSFLGLTHLDQRQADQGNQFSVEPPNQSVAVGNGFILEGVNNAVQVFDTTGVSLLPAVLASNQLFNVAPAIDRNTGINGVFPTDMRVFYDAGISRWIVLQRAQDNDVFGNPLTTSHLYMAVSQSNSPTGLYTVYVMETTNAQNPGCPCYADFPQLGADQYGFYVSTNEFNSSLNQFVDVRILAISKASLAAGAATPTIYSLIVRPTTGFEFTVQPATTPPGASSFLASGGLEFFVSTQSQSADNRFALWALTNTASLGTAQPNLTLIETVVPGLSYTFPDVATQRAGPLPYGSTLVPPGQLAFLDGDDCRVQSLVYSGGRLFLTLSTQLVDSNNHFVDAGAYAILLPTYRGGVLNANIQRQGYLTVTNNHVLNPAVAVNAQGRGAITFTLVGPDYYPSAAFVPIDTVSTGTAVQIGGAGAFPEDGFTGYPNNGTFSTGVARWGDYATAVYSDGFVYMVAEFIPNAPRTQFANWGTQIMRVVP
jgi:hypothetical protein